MHEVYDMKKEITEFYINNSQVLGNQKVQNVVLIASVILFNKWIILKRQIKQKQFNKNACV